MEKGSISSSGLTLDFIHNAAVSNNHIKLSDQPLSNNEELESNTEKNTIKAIIKHSGEITGYELSNGEKITKERGVELAKNGSISGVSVSRSRKGEEYLRSLRDDDESNNLNSLPIVDE
jgi:hypothetical protein